MKADVDDRSKQAARRQREYRARLQAGEFMLRIKISDKVIEALIKRGMADSDSRNRRKLGAELAAVLDQWADVWLK